MQETKHEGKSSTSAVWLVAFFCLLGAYGYSSVTGLLLEVQSNRSALVSITEALILPDEIMQTLETTWIDANGLTHIVTTHREAGESVEDFIARHRAAVDAMKEAFPPAGR